MYMVDNILLVLPIKDWINKDGDPITSFKLATGTKPSISHLCVLFVHILYNKRVFAVSLLQFYSIKKGTFFCTTKM